MKIVPDGPSTYPEKDPSGNGSLLAAPVRLNNFRSTRYKGDDCCSAMAEFAPEDAQIIERLYRFLTGFLGWLGTEREQQLPADATKISRYLSDHQFDVLSSEIRQLGVATCRVNSSERLAKTIHDLRGGGMSALVGEAYFLERGRAKPDLLNSLYFLTRDHLKIMLNALTGLDDARREADLLPRTHSVDLLMEKWQHCLLRQVDHSVEVVIDSSYSGTISECCVEFGAVDRILYNFLNNASRHAQGDQVLMSLLPLPSAEESKDLRFVITNSVSADDAARLREMAGEEDMRVLFKPGVSTTKSGLGLTIAADFVCNAYGLANRQQALDLRYIGAELSGDNFLAWFHWPISQAA